MFGNLWSGFDVGAIDDFRRLERELDRLFYAGQPSPAGIRSMRRGAFPPMNVGTTPERVDVYVFAAGIDPANVDLSIQQNVLSITGRRDAPAGGDDKAAYYRRERFAGEFRRAVTLPEDVDPDRVEAKYRDGVLQVTIQRREAARPRRVPVQ
ncbi:MAG: Hsp20/alpha crystallin family protein [Burkholderiaceae bacterium]|jgi:HSP20 family protein|nr:Hsp20/alpha crystallin family protein [Burkholderiaceae bacterium]